MSFGTIFIALLDEPADPDSYTIRRPTPTPSRANGTNINNTFDYPHRRAHRDDGQQQFARIRRRFGRRAIAPPMRQLVLRL